MKKLISIFVVAALIAVFLMSSVFATEDPQIVVSSAEATRGDEVVLTVSLVNNPGITNGKIVVNYDENALELVKIDLTNTDGYKNGMAMMLANENKMNFMAISDVSADMMMFEIVFKVKDSAGGEHKVDLTIETMKNNAGDDVVFDVVAGIVSVHVCDPVPVEGIPATITSTGVKAHDKCVCGKLYIDGVEVTEEDLVIPMLGQIIVDSVEAATGEEIVLNVALKNNPGITDGKITVDYDATGLELVDIDVTPAYAAGFAMALKNVDAANMNFMAIADIASDFTLFSVKFKVKDDAQGEYKVDLIINKICNNAGEDVGFAVMSGTVTIHNCQAGETVIENVVEATCTTDGSYDEVVYCAGCGEELSREAVVVEATGHEMGEWYVYRASTGKVKGEMRCDCVHCDYYESQIMSLLGDVNGDDNVDTTDAKLIMQYDVELIGEEALDLTVADVNGDGACDTTDAKLIMQLDVGLIEDFPNP